MTNEDASGGLPQADPAIKPSEGSELPSAELAAPGQVAGGLFQQLLFALSLPERTLRSTTALIGGTVHEAATILVPQAFRSSRSYNIFIQQSLDFLLGEVANVRRPTTAAEQTAVSEQDLLARKAVGSFLDLAGLATLHLSPLTVLALLGDIAYGSSTYLKELSQELKKTGLIDEHTTIDHAADLLRAVEHASTVSSQIFDGPPLSVEGLKQTIAQTVDAVQRIEPGKILPQSELKQMWDSIGEIANREGLSVFEVSSTVALYSLNKVGVMGKGALSSATVAGNMFDRHILDHYRGGLDLIRQRGLFAILSESYQPYIDAVWTNFSSRQTTITEDLLNGRLAGKAWNVVSGLWRQP